MRIKKVSSILLCMIITLSSLGNWMNVYAKEDEKNTQDSVTVIACSDYQHPGGNTSGSTTVTNIISQIKAHGYDEADGFLAMGDYDYEYVETAEGIASLKNTVKGAYSELADDRMIFVQGNHDIAGAAGLSASGANDTNEYGVYVIHEDDFPMDGGTDEGVRKVAGELDDYLKAKADAGYEQPIFVVSHVPLHYSTRTRVDGVGKYAQYIFEVLNQRAAEGQTIIYMFGHNHNSWGYDDYLGTGSVYLTEGDELYVGKLGATSAVPTEYELHFTYMNAGYIGYNFSETQGADTTLTMTVFQIEDGLVTVERYSTQGIHNLKSQGFWANNSAQVDMKENYGADDTYLTKVYTSPQYIAVGSVESDKNVQVITSSPITLSVEESSIAKDEKVHRAYRAYDVDVTGYTQGERAIVRVTLPKVSEFDLTNSVFLVEKVTGKITPLPIHNGQVTFETMHLGDFELVQFQSFSTVPIEKTVYQHVPSRIQFTDGKKYLIVSSNMVGDAYALKNDSGETVTSAAVVIQSDADGPYIQTSDNSILWEYELTDSRYTRGVGDLQNLSTGRYLYAGDGTLPLAKENPDLDHTYWTISSSLYMYTYQNWDNREGTRWCIKYRDQFVLDTADHATHRAYVYEETSFTEYESTFIDSSAGRVIVGADNTSNIGSKIVVFRTDGTMDIVDVTISMLRDKNGNVVNTDTIAKQSGLQVYYKDQVIYDDYTLSVCHENGYNYLDISEYRKSSAYTYPEETGYVFAGWYEDANFKKPLDSDVRTGYAYAKFVDSKVLRVRCQITADTTANSESTDLRMLSTVDSLEYQSAGFLIGLNGKTATRQFNTVYETIVGYVDGNQEFYQPSVFSGDSKYFVAYSVTDIPQSAFDSEFIITPMWLTLDGTMVQGARREFVLKDAIEHMQSDTVEVVEDGTIRIQNGYSGEQYAKYVCNMPIKAGGKVSFDIEVTPAQDINVWFLGCDSSKEWSNEWYARQYISGIVSDTITVTMSEDIDVFTIMVSYNDATQDHKSSVVTIKNLTILQDTTNVSADGKTVTIQNAASGGDRAYYICNMPIQKGTKISFDIEVTPAQDISVWFLGCDYKTGWTNEWYAKHYSSGIVSDTITVTTKARIDVFTILVKYNDETQNHANSVLTINNITIEQDKVEIDEDGTITLQNSYTGGNLIYYVCDMPIKKGSQVSFDIEVTPVQDISVWLLGCDYSTGWTNEWYAKQYSSGVVSDTITVTTRKSIDVFSIVVAYNNSSYDAKESVVKIKNLTIAGDRIEVVEDGTIIMQNNYTGSDQAVYVCQESVNSGDLISFNLDVSPKQDITVWVFGCDYTQEGWKNEWKAQTIWNEYGEWPSDGGPAGVSFKAKGSSSVFTIVVQYRDASNAKENVVTISNLKKNSALITN